MKFSCKLVPSVNRIMRFRNKSIRLYGAFLERIYIVIGGIKIRRAFGLVEKPHSREDSKDRHVEEKRNYEKPDAVIELSISVTSCRLLL